jgi:drug/metabolite transporter (DMT)-like permease
MVFAHDVELALTASVALANSAQDPDTLTTREHVRQFYDEQGYTGLFVGDENELDEVRALRPQLRELLTAERDDAVDRMQVGVALLIEFTCPVAVLLWMWWRHAQRPSRLTATGAVLAIGGLFLVLDLTSGADVDPIGLAWAFGAMICAAFYWILSADEDNGLPGIVLAAGGMTFGGLALLLAGVIGIIPFRASTDDVELAGTSMTWWLPLVVLGVLTAGLAYVLSIEGSRRLGSRLGSFVGLIEAVFGVLFAWLLLSEAPGVIQLLGGALILVGVVVVKLGEPRVVESPSAAQNP